MNEYYKNKFKEKHVVGTDVNAQYEQQSDAIADALSTRYSDSIPPQSTVLQKSYVTFSVLDLLSEGPVEGFVDQAGRSTINPLEATYLDDIVVKSTEDVGRFQVESLVNFQRTDEGLIRPNLNAPEDDQVANIRSLDVLWRGWELPTTMSHAIGLRLGTEAQDTSDKNAVKYRYLSNSGVSSTMGTAGKVEYYPEAFASYATYSRRFAPNTPMNLQSGNFTGSDVSLASLAASNAYTFPLSSFNTSLQKVVTLPGLKAAIKAGIDKVSGEIDSFYLDKKKLKSTNLATPHEKDVFETQAGTLSTRKGHKVYYEYGARVNHVAGIVIDAQDEKYDFFQDQKDDYRDSINKNGGFKLSAMVGFNVVDHQSSRYSNRSALSSKSSPKAALYAPNHENGSYGYTRPLYLMLSVYAQENCYSRATSYNQLESKLSVNGAGTHSNQAQNNQVTADNPLTFKGNVVYGLGINSIGSFDSLWSPRTTMFKAYGPKDFDPPVYNSDFYKDTDRLKYYLNSAMSSSDFATRFPNSDRPIRIQYSFVPGTDEPDGLKEPYFNQLQRELNSLDDEEEFNKNFGFVIFEGDLFNISNSLRLRSLTFRYGLLPGQVLNPLPGKKLVYAPETPIYQLYNEEKIDSIVRRQYLGPQYFGREDNLGRRDEYYKSSFLELNSDGIVKYPGGQGVTAAQVGLATNTFQYYRHGVNLSKINTANRKGTMIWPIYLGKNFDPVNAQGEIEESKVLVNRTDPALALKIAEGEAKGYDVMVFDTEGFSYGCCANPVINVPTGSLKGKTISAVWNYEDEGRYNFTRASVDFRNGTEFQTTMEDNLEVSYVINKHLFGPSNPQADIVDSIATSIDDVDGSAGAIGVIKESAEAGTASKDVREGASFSNWMKTIPLNHDAYTIKHIVNSLESEEVKLLVYITKLQRKVVEQINPQRFKSSNTTERISIEIEIGFENLPESVEYSDNYSVARYQKEFIGVVEEAYLNEVGPYPLPSVKNLKNQFPNEFKGLNVLEMKDRYPRYVRVRRTTFESNSILIQREIRLGAVVEMTKNNFTYPYSALVKIDMDGRGFDSTPRRNYLMRLRRVKVPSNYFPLNGLGKDKRFLDKNEAAMGENWFVNLYPETFADNTYLQGVGRQNIYVGDWDGTFKEAWTDNPAWILYDILTNKLWGLGQKMDDDEDIDIFQLYKIGRYCDAVDENGVFVGVDDGYGGLEPRYSCNTVLDKSQSPHNILRDIASCFNGKLYWNGGGISFYCDMPSEPVGLFNNANVKAGLFNYSTSSSTSQFNVARVRFVDKTDHYKIKFETVEDEEGLRVNGPIVQTMNAKGATSRKQATRVGRYAIYTNKLETEMVNFEAGLESLTCTVGDVITVNDELKKFKPGFSRVLSALNENTLIIEPTFDLSTFNSNRDAFIYDTSIQSSGQAEMYEHVNFDNGVIGGSLTGYQAGAARALDIATIEEVKGSVTTVTTTESIIVVDDEPEADPSPGAPEAPVIPDAQTVLIDKFDYGIALTCEALDAENNRITTPEDILALRGTYTKMPTVANVPERWVKGDFKTYNFPTSNPPPKPYFEKGPHLQSSNANAWKFVTDGVEITKNIVIDNLIPVNRVARRYYRIQAKDSQANRGNLNSNASGYDRFRLAIHDISFVDVLGNQYPSALTSDDGGNVKTSTSSEITNGSSYEDYAAYHAFNRHDSHLWNKMFWTIEGDERTHGASYLQIDFGEAKRFTQLLYLANGKKSGNSFFHTAVEVEILASDDPTFETFEVFGEIHYDSNSTLSSLHRYGVNANDGPLYQSKHVLVNAGAITKVNDGYVQVPVEQSAQTRVDTGDVSFEVQYAITETDNYQSHFGYDSRYYIVTNTEDFPGFVDRLPDDAYIGPGGEFFVYTRIVRLGGTTVDPQPTLDRGLLISNGRYVYEFFYRTIYTNESGLSRWGFTYGGPSNKLISFDFALSPSVAWANGGTSPLYAEFQPATNLDSTYYIDAFNLIKSRLRFFNPSNAVQAQFTFLDVPAITDNQVPIEEILDVVDTRTITTKEFFSEGGSQFPYEATWNTNSSENPDSVPPRTDNPAKLFFGSFGTPPRSNGVFTPFQSEEIIQSAITNGTTEGETIVLPPPDENSSSTTVQIVTRTDRVSLGSIEKGYQVNLVPGGMDARNIPTGSYLSVSLDTQNLKQYRILSIEPSKSNLYKITANEYRPEKYAMIESAGDTVFVDRDKNSLGYVQQNILGDSSSSNINTQLRQGYIDIGIPHNDILTPTEPQNVETTLTTLPNGSTNLTVTITAQSNPTEEAYSVRLLIPNGMHKQQVVQKDPSNTTTTVFRNMYVFGDYSVAVTSLGKGATENAY